MFAGREETWRFCQIRRSREHMRSRARNSNPVVRPVLMPPDAS